MPHLGAGADPEVGRKASEDHRAEIEEAQALRYRIFYEDLAATPSPEVAAAKRDFDSFDDYCDHLVVLDHGGGTPRVVANSIWAKSDPASQAEANRWLADWNGPIHRVRGRIEKIFGTWKRSYGFRRMRWRGLAKARLQTHLTAIAYNLKRTLNILSPA